MKILRRLVPFARPLYHFFPEYLIYTFFGILFGLLNFTLLIPILQLLFEQSQIVLADKPEAAFSVEYIKAAFNYYLSFIILNYGKFNALLFVCLIVGFSVLAGNVSRYMAIRTLLRLKLKVMANVRNALYDKLMHQSLAFHHEQSRGNLMSIMSNEVQELEGSVLNSIQILLRDPFVVIAYLGVLFYISPALTLFTLCFLPVSGILISAITRRLKKLSYFSQEDLSQMLTHTDESISGIRQIQSYLAESFMYKRFRELNDRFSRNSKKLISRKEMATPIGEITGVVAALVLIAVGGYLILNGKTNLTGPSFIAYLAMYSQIIQPLKNLSQTSSNLQRGIVACEKIFRLLDTPVKVSNPAQVTHKDYFTDKISFNNVWFRYQEKWVLQQVSFEIPKGSTIALVGQSGSGKSTIADLLLRFYDVEQGSITVDGIDIRNINTTQLRSLLSMVSQDSFLFNDSIYNNIRLGKPDATEEEVIRAAKAAYAHDFIQGLENKYETITGERGVKLSGGQRQRISIARAILKNAPILILDEATSALDTESEKYVQQALKELMKDRTSLIIAHRLSTVKHADHILVLQEGKIIQSGTHDKLLQEEGMYRRLVEMQEVS